MSVDPDEVRASVVAEEQDDSSNAPPCQCGCDAGEHLVTIDDVFGLSLDFPCRACRCPRYVPIRPPEGDGEGVLAFVRYLANGELPLAS